VLLPFSSILCPVDFSDQSQVALRWAVALATRFQSRLTVLSAVEPLLAEAALSRYGVDLAKVEGEGALREFAAAAVAAVSPGLAPAIEVRVGKPPAAIAATADAHQCDLVVIGTHGLGGLRKLLLGSTTEQVLRRTRVPVLAVPGGDVPMIDDASGRRLAITSALAATDFSETARRVVEFAVEIAVEFAIPLILAHAVAPLSVPGRWQRYVDLGDEERIAQARGRLEGWLKESGERIQGDVVVGLDRPADFIASSAVQHGAGLIIMGLSGSGGATGSPRPGSIAYRVLCAARVPVLLVPPGRDRSDRPVPQNS
jgi:nucleotide-binding universal stress UspA family protein